MKQKPIIILVLLLIMLQFSLAEKRKIRLSMKDLTDPSSPSYVPYPYPKSEFEVIEDLKYAIEKQFPPNGPRTEVLMGYQNSIDKMEHIQATLFKKNSPYKIQKICKVKHSFNTDLKGYEWLIYIVDLNGYEATRVSMKDNGLWAGSAISDNKKPPYKPLSDEEVIVDLSNVLKIPILKKDVKNIDRIAYSPLMGALHSPAFEITLKNGNVYYYNNTWKKCYRVKKEIPYIVEQNGRRSGIKDNISPEDIFSVDQINDKFIVYEEIKTK